MRTELTFSRAGELIGTLVPAASVRFELFVAMHNLLVVVNGIHITYSARLPWIGCLFALLFSYLAIAAPPMSPPRLLGLPSGSENELFPIRSIIHNIASNQPVNWYTHKQKFIAQVLAATSSGISILCSVVAFVLFLGMRKRFRHM